MSALRVLSPERSFRVTTQATALTALRPGRPVGCLLQWQSGVLHWVTVIGVVGGFVHFNHWGRQDKLAQAEFTARWGFRQQRFTDAALATLGGISAYTAVS